MKNKYNFASNISGQMNEMDIFKVKPLNLEVIVS